MIQRIQSLHLILIVVLSVLFLTGTFLDFTDESGQKVSLALNGNLGIQSGVPLMHVSKIWIPDLILAALPLMSLITMFWFRNRKIQMLLAVSVTSLASALIIALSWFALNLANSLRLGLRPGIRLAIPALILVFSILAYRGILKDDRLVKSYDRLR